MHRFISARGALISATALVLLLLITTARTGAVSGARTIQVRDDCDPATFNAALGAGTCVGNGGTTFEEFNAELASTQKVGSWKFNPHKFKIDAGERTLLENRGGEFHTFTKVAEFGGGIVQPLNDLSGTPVPTPECILAFLGGPSATNFFLNPGQRLSGPTAGTAALPVGVSKYQCCIHPWMKTTVEVRHQH
ncbi:MAG TPA: hypothetical protein VGV59_20450 [Pyrinomonadaceae bacterium]|nr:hypothetical protein [Pyrinomonadaceae bacterium]